MIFSTSGEKTMKILFVRAAGIWKFIFSIESASGRDYYITILGFKFLVIK